MFPTFVLQQPLHRLARALSCALLLVGISALAVPTAAACENPATLTFSLVPTEDTAAELQLYQPLIQHLSTITGKDIDFYSPTSYASVMEAIASGWVDIAVLGPASYTLAKAQNDDIVVFATYTRHAGHMQEEGPGYRANLISRADSGIETIEQSRGTTLGLVDPASTSGHLLPMVAFAGETGEGLEDFYERIVYTGGHDLSALAVLEGRVDVAFVATHRFDNVVDRGDITLDDVNILWRSAVVPQDPFVFRTTLCEDLRESIVEAFLTAHEVPGLAPYFEAINSPRFVPMQDSDYDLIRQLQSAAD
ncbi:phosphate/phosphite/phosphonate ABC transporter substrate-binding protein [Desulfobulbus alkaliphilus]|uniref:phosphate/phosphite/phosphonate ABC transporter substrate-binding protein n=1 Tax=Desulfobulbus alkaliphilus TaxID=869814 RepID=UPI0019644A01|nr:phosphate/phosphite/phosphonate ABC transporter substrate-binding protein [Desulfobulbus alkaliphilus]MBM9536108.1 phosphate/phosphite/phosphonate ABC transporter substrate-binding protein [Desulfobulbus alkaliphilus]